MAAYDPYLKTSSAPAPPPPPGAYPPNTDYSGQSSPPPYYPNEYSNQAPPNYPTGGADPEAGVTENVTLGTAETKVKLGFLRKVYSLLTLCLAVTVAISCVFSFVVPVREFIVARPYFIWIGLAVGLCSYIGLVCFRLKKPWNALMLGVFVLGFSLMIGTICAAYFAAGWGKVVIQAFAATVCIFVSLTAYVLITKKDFSYLAGFLLGAMIALIVLSLLTFLSGLFFGVSSGTRWLYFGVSVLGALVYTLFILFDTSQILHRYGPDEWIVGVVDLYVDFSQLFLYLLNIISCFQ